MAIHHRYRPTYYTSPRWLPKTALAGVAVGQALATSTATAEGIAIAEAAGSATAFSIATAEGQPVAEVSGMVRRRSRRRKPVIVGAGVGEIALEGRGEGRVIIRGAADVTHEVATTASSVNVHRQNEQALALLLLLDSEGWW